jgi:hypothetical protein
MDRICDYDESSQQERATIRDDVKSWVSQLIQLSWDPNPERRPEFAELPSPLDTNKWQLFDYDNTDEVHGTLNQISSDVQRMRKEQS